MLTKMQIENSVMRAMEKYEKEHGQEGWPKADIWNTIQIFGGDQDDLYEAMALAMDLCLGKADRPVRRYS